jgi:hypothetical protein
LRLDSNNEPGECKQEGLRKEGDELEKNGWFQKV